MLWIILLDFRLTCNYFCKCFSTILYVLDKASYNTIHKISLLISSYGMRFVQLQQACIFLFPFHSPCPKKVWLAPNSILLLPATSSNYPSYKPQFDCLLVGYDLLGILNGTHSCLPDQFSDQDGKSTTNLAHVLWFE